MLPRSLARTACLFASSVPHIVCRACTCKCGREISQYDSKSIHTRSLANLQQAHPSSPRAGAIQGQEVRQGLNGENATKLYRALMRRKLDASLQGQPDQLLRFVERVANVAAAAAARTGPGVNTTAFQELMNEIDVSRRDARWCAHWMVSRTEQEFRKLGRKIMYTLSHSGDGQATLIIVEGTLGEKENRTRLLKSSELVLVRRQLTAMAEGTQPDAMEDADQLFMAKVCEGKVAHALNDIERAFDMWRAAMDDAKAYAQKRGERANDTATLRSNSSPWIDLFNLSLAQGNLEVAKWAAEVGCQVDDPISHYQAAALQRDGTLPAEKMTTSTWLYHMTKSAASGNVQAIHALGIYYSSAEWKYFQDEPPDEVKPTPFDSYPSAGSIVQSTGQRIGAVFGLRPLATIDPKNSLFLTAVFPSGAYERWKMAAAWLDTAMNMLYVPSFLAAAKLYLQESFSGREGAPKVALGLGDQRYDYASKADHDDGRIIRQLTTNKPPLEHDRDLANPGFDPEKAKMLIREIFFASQAQAYRRDRLSQLNKAGSLKANTASMSRDTNKMLGEEMLESNVSPNIRKWSRFPEVMQLCTDDRRGALYDDFTHTDLLLEARKICNEMQWDLYDEEGGLMYKYR